MLVFFGTKIREKNKQNFRVYIFFTFWFILGLLPHLQIIPLDATVADRWFYFPMIGLLGLIAIIFQALFTHLHNNQLLRTACAIVLVTILIVFSGRVMVRGLNWKNQLTLMEHDITYNRESF